MVVRRSIVLVDPQGRTGVRIRDGRIIVFAAVPGNSCYEHVATAVHGNGGRVVKVVCRPVVIIGPEWYACVRVLDGGVVPYSGAARGVSRHKHVAAAVHRNGRGPILA